MKKQIVFAILAALLASAPLLHAQSTPSPTEGTSQKAEELISKEFTDAPLEMVIEFYNQLGGGSLIPSADLSPKVSFKFSQLSKDEAMQAIETVLAMKGVALVPMKDKFLRGRGPYPTDAPTTSDPLIHQIIPLRYVDFSKVQPILQQCMHGHGKIVQLEHINSILVIDSSANVARIVEILGLLDQPREKIEPRIYQLNHAKAGYIATKLRKLVDASQASGSSSNNSQMIQGDIKIVSDERTNILIVFSPKANDAFFDRTIKELDAPLVGIEAVCLSINIGDKYPTGMDWVYEQMRDENQKKRAAPPKDAEATTGSPIRPLIGTTPLHNLDVADLFAAAKSNNAVSILSTPFVMTTDNTETKIMVDNQTPVIGHRSSQTTNTPYEYKTLGFELTITPHISPQGFVLLEIPKSDDDINSDTIIFHNDVPTIISRSVAYTAGVNSGETIALDGRILKSTNPTLDPKQLVILLTPHVLITPEEVRIESERRFNSTDSKTTKWPRAWSLSDLANDEDDDAAWRRKQDKADDE
jgi:type II secretory pathway component GspD/PulD (secretin)